MPVIDLAQLRYLLELKSFIQRKIQFPFSHVTHDLAKEALGNINTQIKLAKKGK